MSTRGVSKDGNGLVIGYFMGPMCMGCSNREATKCWKFSIFYFILAKENKL